MIAQNIEIFAERTLTAGVQGTSFATPLWAGFTTLANQLNKSNGGRGLMGFLNPALYDIGLTISESGDADLYNQCFNDIREGTNGGFKAVTGYDLVTGLGSPKGALITQLASAQPAVPAEFHLIRFIVGTSGDDLRQDSTATATVFLKNGGSFTVTLKAKGAPSWANGSVHGPIDFTIPSSVTLPTPAQGLSGVRINLVQGGSFPESDDNWDIGSLNVSLLNPGSEQACQLNLVGKAKLPGGFGNAIGLVRLTGSDGSSPVFATGPDSGC